jgi:hypothetical protein
VFVTVDVIVAVAVRVAVAVAVEVLVGVDVLVAGVGGRVQVRSKSWPGPSVVSKTPLLVSLIWIEMSVCTSRSPCWGTVTAHCVAGGSVNVQVCVPSGPVIWPTIGLAPL